MDSSCSWYGATSVGIGSWNGILDWETLEDHDQPGKAGNEAVTHALDEMEEIHDGDGKNDHLYLVCCLSPHRLEENYQMLCQILV